MSTPERALLKRTIREMQEEMEAATSEGQLADGPYAKFCAHSQALWNGIERLPERVVPPAPVIRVVMPPPRQPVPMNPEDLVRGEGLSASAEHCLRYMGGRIARLEQERDELIQKYRGEMAQHMRYNVLKTKVNRLELDPTLVETMKHDVRREASTLFDVWVGEHTNHQLGRDAVETRIFTEAIAAADGVRALYDQAMGLPTLETDEEQEEEEEREEGPPMN